MIMLALGNIALVGILGYLSGSLPFSFLIAYFVSHLDLRRVGTKNVGAANVKICLGKFWGLLALVLDILKGVLPVFLVIKIWNGERSLALFSGLFAILGHNFPLWLGFKGGRGLATSIGVFMFLYPWQSLLCAGLVSIFWLFLKSIVISISLCSWSLPLFLFLSGYPYQEVFLVLFILLGLHLYGWSFLKEYINSLKKCRKSQKL